MSKILQRVSVCEERCAKVHRIVGSECVKEKQNAQTNHSCA